MFAEILAALRNLISGGTMPPAEVATKLDDIAKSHHDLNWRSSIVDLLKLLNLDNSTAARAKLATELGYDGAAADGSTEKNLWLHKAVMAKIASHGIKLG